MSDLIRRHAWLPLALVVVLVGSMSGRAQERKSTDSKDGDKKAAKPRFIDRGEYVEDTTTGLLWQKDGTASGKLNFDGAAKYAESLKLGGMKRWRVPTRKELEGIFPATEKPFTNTKYNENACCAGPGEYNSYWTSELDPRLDDYAWIYQWYAKGGANNGFASRNFVYVRCVHNPAPPTPAGPPADEATLRKAKELIALLGDEKFEVRSKATADLKAIAAKVVPLLRETVETTKDAEVRVRIEAILSKLE